MLHVLAYMVNLVISFDLAWSYTAHSCTLAIATKSVTCIHGTNGLAFEAVAVHGARVVDVSSLECPLSRVRAMVIALLLQPFSYGSK